MFVDLGYEDYRRLGRDRRLSQYNRIGFPDSYRKGLEPAIFSDIRRKLPTLEEEGRIVLDIGPGCSDIPRMLIDLCAAKKHQLLLVDSDEMLDQLPDLPFITKITGMYPANADAVARAAPRGVHAILSYSVLHSVFIDASVSEFLGRAMLLLRPGGQMLLGDIPNASKRARFFASETGAAFFRKLKNDSAALGAGVNAPRQGKIDDAVIMALLAQARAAGADAYVLPQSPELPMANRREDILVYRP
jgi:hypothetical protein